MKRTCPSRTGLLAAAVCAALLSGCAHYKANPLPTSTSFKRDLGQLSVESNSMPTLALRAHRFDPSDGLDMTEVAMLAVANNPDLRLARADVGLSRAQAFSAGLLPDPQLSVARTPQMGNPPDSSIAFNASLTIDISSIINRPNARRAAANDTRKVNLNLLWQELQVISQARTLFVKVTTQERTYAVLDKSRALFQDRLDRTRTAASRGLLATDSVTPHLTALQDVLRQLNDLERQRNQSRHDLNTLLGVAPDVDVRLVGQADLPPIDAAQAADAVRDLPARRADLRALQAGYAAEDDRYRGALLAQFPALTITPQRARDTTYINTSGVGIGIALPLFNRNRGNIAIELATRDKLKTEYQGRLDAATSEIDRLMKEQRIVERQLAAIAPALAELQTVADRAETAFAARNVDALVLTNAQTALLGKQIEQITLQEALQDQRISLQTLIAADVGSDQVPQ